MPISDELFEQPILSDHLPFPRGWPLNRGSIVTAKNITFCVYFSLGGNYKEVLFLGEASSKRAQIDGEMNTD